MGRVTRLGRLSRYGIRTFSSGPYKKGGTHGKSVDPKAKGTPTAGAEETRVTEIHPTTLRKQAPLPPPGGPKPGESTSAGRASGLGARTPGPAGTLPPPGSKPPAGNRWLFSPSFPVDVRLLGAGTAALGGFITYAYYDKVNKQKQQEPVERHLGDGAGEISDAVPSLESAPDVAIIPEGSPPAEQQQRQGDESTSSEGESQPEALSSSFYDDELALEAGASTSESIAQAADNEPEEGEGDFMGLEDVQNLQAQAEDPGNRAVADLLNSVLAGQVQAVEATLPEDPPAPTATDQGEAATGKSGADEEEELAQAKKEKTAADRKLQEQLEVVKQGLGDTSGETILASAAAQLRSSKKKREADAAEGAAVEGEPSGAPETELGITEDLRPAALMRSAIERGEGSGENWGEYRQRLVQAESDALTFQRAREQAVRARQEEMAKLKAASEEQERQVADLKQTIASNAAKFQEVLKAQDALATDQKQEELKRQAEFMATAFAEAALKERSTRLAALDDVRMKLNSLSTAFGQRSEEQASSHVVHKLSLGTFGLENALQEGLPFDAQARSLEASCAEDPLVAAAVQSLPEATRKGVATRAQLLDRWPRMRQLSAQLSYLPPGQTGIIQLGLASLATKLKVREGASEGEPETVDQVLAQVDDMLTEGKYARAAATLEKGLAGTAAEGLVGGWAAELRARAVADQAVKLLQAHASSKAASLS